MEYIKEDYTNALMFIKAYLHMENASLVANKRIFKSILPERKFNHLFDSWASRNNDFGSFYLNLDHKIQCLFLLNWGIQIPGYEEYLIESNSNPYASVYTNPPVNVSKLHELLLFFNNHGIDENAIADFSLNNLPALRYGNSTNWGNYIISLTAVEQENLIKKLTAIAIVGIKDQEKNRAFIKNATLKQNQSS